MFNFFKKSKPSQEPSNKNQGKEERTEISVGYTYEYLDEVPADERTPCNAFCAKLEEMSRVYSRVDIEKMSTRLGYSVWDRRGGWIDKGDKDENGEPIEHRYIKDGVEYYHCKHQWVSKVLIKKK